MKIRSGFVSNSSSSSFLVIFPREPKSAEDVRTMLFDEIQTLYGEYDEFYPVSQVAETVWSDICNQKKNDIKTAKEELGYGGCYDSPNYSDFDHIKDWKERSAAYDSVNEIYADKKMKEFFNPNFRKLKLKKINNEAIVDPGTLYIFQYSDNDGSYGAALEHGSLFNKLKYIRISKH
jgi:hypothetical protein